MFLVRPRVRLDYVFLAFCPATRSILFRRGWGTVCLVASLTASLTMVLVVVGTAEPAFAAGPPKLGKCSFVPDCDASEVGAESVVLEPSIDPSGGDTFYKLEYATAEGGPWTPVPGGSGLITTDEGKRVLHVELTGLDPETTYYVRVSAGNEYGTVEGGSIKFATEGLAPNAWGVTLLNTSSTSARFEAGIKSHLDETHWRLEYADVESGPWTPFASGTALASDKLQWSSAQELTHLTPATAYYVREFLTSEAGDDTSSTLRFETLAVQSASPPVIEGESASNITSTDAVLRAQINPEDLEAGVDYQFQIVTDPNEYRSEIVCPSETGGPFLPCGPRTPGALPINFISAGLEGQAVSLDLAGAGMALQGGITYHYRVLAARAIQSVDTISWERPIVVGSDQTFMTPTVTPAGGGQDASGGQGTVQGSFSQPVSGITGLSFTNVAQPMSVGILTNAEKFARAWRVCAKKRKRQRVGCERQLLRRYYSSSGRARKLSRRKRRSARGS